MNSHSNLVGQWYVRRDLGEVFQVTGYDDRWRTIEIQTFDGNLDEIEEDSWRALPLTPVEAPKDWTGPLDGVELEDADLAGDGSEDIGTDAPTWQELAADGGLDADVDEWIDPAAAEPTRQRPPARLSDSYAAWE